MHSESFLQRRDFLLLPSRILRSERKSIESPFMGTFQINTTSWSTGSVSNSSSRSSTQNLTACLLNADNLQALSVMLTKWFAQLHRQAKTRIGQLLPLLFTTMQQELSLLLIEWARYNPVGELPQHMTLETIVMVISWAIFGTSLQWAHGARSLSPKNWQSKSPLC